MEDGTKKRGTILYAVLTSLVQGRPQKVLKSIQPGNGFECYRVLADQATPQLRARALALLQSVLQYSFSRTATLTENLQRLDDLVNTKEPVVARKLELISWSECYSRTHQHKCEAGYLFISKRADSLPPGERSSPELGHADLQVG